MELLHYNKGAEIKKYFSDVVQFDINANYSTTTILKILFNEYLTDCVIQNNF